MTHHLLAARQLHKLQNAPGLNFAVPGMCAEHQLSKAGEKL